jgi:hypothetical protein
MSLIIGDSRSIHGRTITSDAPSADQFMKWDGATSQFEFETVEASKKVCVAFTYTTISPLTIYYTVPGDAITGARIHIETEFNETSTVSIGHSGSQVAIMDTAENFTTEAGDYECTRFMPYSGSDAIKLYINPGASIQGTGYVILFVTTVA